MSSEICRRNDEEHRKPTPLPKLQLFIVYLIQFAEPITALVIYPFVNQFVRDTGITQGDEIKTGYYAGIIESTFFLAECLTVVQWGYLSDRFGRRPVLLVGPLGLSISMLLFGLSSTFWPLVVFRCLQGTFNGNIGISKSIIAEITDETNIGDAYAYVPLMWSSATTLAPIIGGVLSQPAERWPDIFGRMTLFLDHPYFLPCLTAAFIAFLSFVMAFFALKETLHSIVAAKEKKLNPDIVGSETPLINDANSVSYDAVSSSPHVSETSDGATLFEDQSFSIGPTTPSIRLLFHRPLLLVYLNYIFLTFLDMANFVLLPLMYSTPIEYGGLGLSPFHIGTALGIFGILNAIFQAKFLGTFMRRYGPRKLYKFGILSLCVTIMMGPIMRHFVKRAGRVDGCVIVSIGIHLASLTPIYMAYGSILLLINQSVPAVGLLGTANGVGQMLASGMRTFAPSLASSLFSISLQKDLAGGNLVYFVLFGLGLLGVRLSFLLVEDRLQAGRTNY